MTEALELIMRCKSCGYKFKCYMTEKEAYKYRDNIFAPSLCPNCKPQQAITNYFI